VFDDLEDAVQALRESGRRLSAPRRLVLEALFTADGPMSAARIARALTLDESSVYRNLELLEQQGLLRHIHLGHGPGLYALVGPEDVEYLYCDRCAKVTAVTPAQLDPVREQLRAQFGYTARFTHFAIVGVCADCEAENASTGAGHLHSHGDRVHSHPLTGEHQH
jgi:Fur family transcriptional regulator, ferric uptake regulator